MNAKVKEIAYKLWCNNEISKCVNLVNEKKEEYNNEPLYWCNICNSLSIVNCDSPLDDRLTCYCNECNSTDIKKGNVQEWLKIKNK